MIIEYGKKAIKLTWQSEFPKTIKCTCGGDAKIAMAIQEEDEEKYICDIHDNEGKGSFWPHDAVAVAIYFCKECFNCVTKWNQA